MKQSRDSDLGQILIHAHHTRASKLTRMRVLIRHVSAPNVAAEEMKRRKHGEAGDEDSKGGPKPNRKKVKVEADPLKKFLSLVEAGDSIAGDKFKPEIIYM